MPTFEPVKYLSLVIFLLFVCPLQGQDKIYLLNGEFKTGAVKEIGPELIRFNFEGELQDVSTYDVMLIEFANGTVEIINKPTKNVLFIPSGAENKKLEKNTKSLQKTNLISFNTLALFNSDASFFYEKILVNHQLGLGLMGAYNFNNYANIVNTFIFALGNGKKNYDLGLTANYYFNDPLVEKSFYFGMMFKYTSIKFNKTIVTPGGGNVTYQPKTGSQMSTIFTIGRIHHFKNNAFVKTIFGLGGFNLKGDYRDEFNYVNTNPNGQNRQQRFLPKLYFGINAGLSF